MLTVLVFWSRVRLVPGSQDAQHRFCNTKGHTVYLVAQPLDPPYRARGYRSTYRTYVFQVLQGIALYPQNLPYRSRAEGVAGGIGAHHAMRGYC